MSRAPTSKPYRAPAQTPALDVEELKRFIENGLESRTAKLRKLGVFDGQAGRRYEVYVGTCWAAGRQRVYPCLVLQRLDVPRVWRFTGQHVLAFSDVMALLPDLAEVFGAFAGWSPGRRPEDFGEVVEE